MTVPGQLPTSDLAPPDDAATSGATGTAAVQVRADSGITRLAPADGLFLRAEHLVQMQDYARDLTQALGVATGSGVIHGFRAVLDGDTLQVGAGLAVTTAGRPLRTRQTVPIPLRDLIPACDRFWVLEVAEGVPRPFGEENVYGSVCDDPCDAS
ncbi:MAG: hypothetical protein ACRDSN_13285, partial [Pseudonocardiaceae bacterium]